MSSGNTVRDGSGDPWWLLIDDQGRLISVGPAAENAAVVGNPVLVGGRYDVVARTLGDGDVGGIALDAAGRAQVVTNTGGRSIIQLSTDGQIKAAGGTLHGLIITSVGVTANDTIIIKDGGVGGTERIRITLNTDETVSLLGIDATFATDIFSDETLAGGGTIYVTGIYT